MPKITFWSQDIDLYLLLHLSDIVVTCFSTVGTEAVYFHKPLVILDHLKEDILHYIAEGVAFAATNSIELKTCLERIFSHQLVFDTNIYEEYIGRYALRIDGQASKRFVDFMTGLIRQELMACFSFFNLNNKSNFGHTL